MLFYFYYSIINLNKIITIFCIEANQRFNRCWIGRHLDCRFLDRLCTWYDVFALKFVILLRDYCSSGYLFHPDYYQRFATIKHRLVIIC